jgi:hypothetical protein
MAVIHISVYLRASEPFSYLLWLMICFPPVQKDTGENLAHH